MFLLAILQPNPMESALDPLDLQLLFDFASRGQEMKKIVDMINYEIEYVLRPHTAPARFIIQLSP